MDGNGRQAPRDRATHLRDLPVLRWIVYAVITTVAVFSFIVSYSHIYDLGREHAQFGTAARLLPLSVDLLIVAASLVLFIQYRESAQPEGLAQWLPRLTLYVAIGATVAANVFYGLPHGWLAAVISGWPGAAFVAAVEVGMVIARPASRSASATASGTASVKLRLPSLREIQDRQSCGQETARKIRAELAAFTRGQGGPSGDRAPALATQNPRPGQVLPVPPTVPAGAATVSRPGPGPSPAAPRVPAGAILNGDGHG